MSEEFKRWLALYFIEKGNWRLTDKAIEEFGTDTTPKQTMEFAEDYSAREREERTQYRVGLTAKEKKKIAHMRVADMVDEGKAEELYDNGYITDSHTRNWKDKSVRIFIVNNLVKILDKDPRNLIGKDFYNNMLAGLLNHHGGSPYEVVKEAFSEITIYAWEMAKTPTGFYEKKENRIAAIKWLVLEKLKKDPRDLTVDDFNKNRLRGLLGNYYNDSQYEIVKEAFPELDIKAWEMARTPTKFYEKKENRIAAVKWLVLEKLKKDPKDLTADDFHSNRFVGLLKHYNGSPYEAVKEAFPEMNIRPWEMAMTPRGFFDKEENRIGAVKWLVEKLKKDQRDLTQEDFNSNRLVGLLHHYNSSPYEAVKEAFSEMNIRPWEMAMTPRGFFDKEENRIAAVKWLVERLKKDQRDLTQEDFNSNRLVGLFDGQYNSSPYKAVNEAFPELKICPWEMAMTPMGFYEKKENRIAAVKWLVEKLKKDPRDLTAKDFLNNRLRGLLHRHNNSPYKALKEAGLVNKADEDYMRSHARKTQDTPSSKEAREAARKIERKAAKKQTVKPRLKRKR